MQNPLREYLEAWKTEMHLEGVRIHWRAEVDSRCVGNQGVRPRFS
ncbi:MAG TPA: hypothetical protein P5560_07860 [Thermotogota bacterium]|nr:hypothetical protein [Thermotogota bacterium]HRW92840.1 hypothetical protein [Thermotogota bacterium]